MADLEHKATLELGSVYGKPGKPGDPRYLFQIEIYFFKTSSDKGDAVIKSIFGGG